MVRKLSFIAVVIGAFSAAIFAMPNLGHAQTASVCGDLNNDYLLTPSDVVLEQNYVFLGQMPSSTPNAFWRADVNGDGILTSTDAVRLLNAVYLGQPLSCAPKNQPPIINYFTRGSTSTIPAGFPETWYARATDPEGQMLFYTVTWGNFASSTYTNASSGLAVTFNHTFNIPGTYYQRLVVSDPYGGVASTTTSVTVTSSSPSIPVAPGVPIISNDVTIKSLQDTIALLTKQLTSLISQVNALSASESQTAAPYGSGMYSSSYTNTTIAPNPLLIDQDVNPPSPTLPPVFAYAFPLGFPSGRTVNAVDDFGGIFFQTSSTVALNMLKVTFSGSLASSTRFLDGVTLVDQSGMNVVYALPGTTVATSSKCNGLNTCSKSWNFPVGSSGWLIGHPGYNFKLRINDTLGAPALPNVSLTLSARISSALDVRYTGGGTSGLALSNTSMPVTINAVSYTVGTGGGSNQPPSISRFYGESVVAAGTPHMWNFQAFDAESPLLQYLITWDNLGFSSSSGMFSSGALTGVSHTYFQAGSYIPRLTVFDGDGASAASSTFVTVTGDNQPPYFKQAFSGPSSVISGVSNTWNAMAVDPEGGALQYAIKWGDGFASGVYASSGMPVSFSHAYFASTTATFFPTAQVFDNQFGSATSGPVPVTVSPAVANQPPTAFISGSSTVISGVPGVWFFRGVDPEGGMLNYTVYWNDDSLPAQGSAASGSWFSLTHTYGVATQKTISVDMTDAGGLTGFSSLPITILPGTVPPAPQPIKNVGVDVGASVLNSFQFQLNSIRDQLQAILQILGSSR